MEKDPYTDRVFLLDSKHAVPNVSILDNVTVSSLAEPRQGQEQISGRVDDLVIRDLSDIQHDRGRLFPRGYKGAYRLNGHSPYFDTHTSVGIVREEGGEVLAIAGAVSVKSNIVVVQVQGSITKDVNFSTGLTYRQAKRYLSGFDWRGTLVGAYEKVAESNRKHIAILPNARNRWEAINSQLYNNILSYDELALERGYKYDPKRQLFMKPQDKTKRSWSFSRQHGTTPEILAV